MDCAYLKNAVGAVLTKAIAETVVAQPSNPQQYLALYLLHHVQEEDFRRVSIANARKADDLRAEWASQRAADEEAAMVVLGRAFRRFHTHLQRRKREQARLQELCERAEEDVEDLLERARNNDDTEYSAEGTADGEKSDLAKSPHARVRERYEAMQDAQAEYFKAQSHIQQFSKSHLGALKHYLLQHAERIRVAQDSVQSIHDSTVAAKQQSVSALAASAQSAKQKERDRWMGVSNNDSNNSPSKGAASSLSTPLPHAEFEQVQPHLGNAAGVPSSHASHFSQAAQQLLNQSALRIDHTHIHVPHVAYRVLRCVCYLLLNSTPKATDSPRKVAALIKPAILLSMLTSFSPVTTYDTSRPFRFAKALGLTKKAHSRNRAAEGDALENNDENEDVSDDDASADAEEPQLVAQPTTRQVRRAQRVLRTTLLDGEYVCELNYADYFDEETLEQHAELRSASEAAEQACARASAIRHAVEQSVQSPSSSSTSSSCGDAMVLGLVLRFVSAAVAYRQARDAWAQSRQEAGLPIPPTQELAEDEEADEMNDEVLYDEDGRVDRVAVQRLHARIGVDVDEALAKLWEAEDRRCRRAVLQSVDAYRHMDEAMEDEEEDGEAEG